MPLERCLQRYGRDVVSMSGKSICHVNAASLPAELRGLARDSVSLLTLDLKDNSVSLGTFRNDIGRLLKAGDLMVFNDSRMISASFSAYFREVGSFGRINLGTNRNRDLFLAEPRPRSLNPRLKPGYQFTIAGSAALFTVMARHSKFPRYWWVQGRKDVDRLLSEGMHAVPIRYGYIPFQIPIDYYSSLFSSVPGSVEYPCASRPFTQEIIEHLRSKGVRIATLTLHCNLGSLEPQEFEIAGGLIEEYYNIPGKTLDIIESTRQKGGRIIAAGTTVTRAIESAFAEHGRVKPSGWTDIFIKPGYELKVVDGLITGIHDAESSHLSMVGAFSGTRIARYVQEVACEKGLLQHEFGDSMMVM